MTLKQISREKPSALMLGIVIITSSFLTGPVLAWISRHVLSTIVSGQGAVV